MDAVVVGKLDDVVTRCDRAATAGAQHARHPLAVVEMPAALGSGERPIGKT
jgi:hypothetical protein